MKASPNPSRSKTEIDVAVDPLDPNDVIVVSKDLDPLASDCVWNVPEVTHDRGHTWRTTYVGGKLAERKPGDVLYGWACSSDPMVVFDKDGNAYDFLQVYNLGTGGSATSVPGTFAQGGENVLAVSHDGGDTWPDIVRLHETDGVALYDDEQHVASNPVTGTTYQIWNQKVEPSTAAGAGVWFATVLAIPEGTLQPRAPVLLPLPDASSTGTAQVSILAGRDGAVYALYAGGTYYLSTSHDDGKTFGSPTPIPILEGMTPVESPLLHTHFRVVQYVQAAIDRSGGPRDDCIYAVFSDGARGRGDADILSTHSCDHGAAWAPFVRVNQDRTASDQIMPRVAVDERGVVHVVYITRAYDPANTLLDAEVASSQDGGNAWTTRRLTTTSYDGDLGVHQDGSPFFGDYIGIDSEGGRTYMGFPDCTTGVCEIGVSLVT